MLRAAIAPVRSVRLSRRGSWKATTTPSRVTCTSVSIFAIAQRDGRAERLERVLGFLGATAVRYGNRARLVEEPVKAFASRAHAYSMIKS